MGNLYILMGEENTRKSVTIRALTGLTRRNPLEVRLIENGDTKTIYVIAASAQEDRKGFSNKVDWITQKGHDWDVLLALHPQQAFNFIRQIPEVNRQEIHIVPLGAEGIPTDLQQDISGLPSSHLRIYPSISASRTMPANEIAHQIRDEWGWL